MKYNYHTHTARCYHAQGTDEAFVLAAIDAGFEELGFADHSPWKFPFGYVSKMRMAPRELREYSESIKRLREKYKDQISIRLGLECEYFPRYMPWLEKEIEKNEIDYIILGHHFCGNEIGGAYNGAISTPEDIYRYRDDILEAMDTGLFSYVAHPDIFMRGYERFDRHCERVSVDIIEKAIETSTPLEYNLLGFKHGVADAKPGYPNPIFWNIASEMKPLAIVGVDAHTPEAFSEKELFDICYQNLHDLGLKTVETIKFFQR